VCIGFSGPLSAGSASSPYTETPVEAGARRAEVARLLAAGVLRVDQRGYVTLATFMGRDAEDFLCFKENIERGDRYEAKAAAEGRSVEAVCREAGGMATPR
jgi:hypothetical protein